MYKFFILAYEKELNKKEQEEMGDNVIPGMLKWATEIHIVAESAAEALQKSSYVFMAKNYFIKRIEQL